MAISLEMIDIFGLQRGRDLSKARNLINYLSDYFDQSVFQKFLQRFGGWVSTLYIIILLKTYYGGHTCSF